ncbi:hypothetical protein SPURM210S_04853 [Streptomyces purpurascens]
MAIVDWIDAGCNDDRRQGSSVRGVSTRLLSRADAEVYDVGNAPGNRDLFGTHPLEPGIPQGFFEFRRGLGGPDGEYATGSQHPCAACQSGVRVEISVALRDGPAGAVVDVENRASNVSDVSLTYVTRSASTIFARGSARASAENTESGPSRCHSTIACSRSTTAIPPQRGSAAAWAREKPTPSPPISTSGRGRPARASRAASTSPTLRAAVGGVHQEAAVRDDLQEVTVPPQHDLAVRALATVQYIGWVVRGGHRNILAGAGCPAPRITERPAGDAVRGFRVAVNRLSRGAGHRQVGRNTRRLGHDGRSARFGTHRAARRDGRDGAGGRARFRRRRGCWTGFPGAGPARERGRGRTGVRPGGGAPAPGAAALAAAAQRRRVRRSRSGTRSCSVSPR